MQEGRDQNVPPFPSASSEQQQNPGQQSSGAPKKDELEQNHQDDGNQKELRPIEIVRSIASYLSLSDVESIGSLYSLVSPQAQAQGYNAYRGTPKLWRTGSTSGHHGTNSGSNSFPSNNHEEMTSGNSSLLTRHRFSSLASIDDNMMDYTDSSEGGGNHSAQGSESGPDAPAGIGTDERRSVTSSWGRNMVFDENDMSETPGLVAMSPVPLDDNDEISTSCSSMCHYPSKNSASYPQHEMLDDDSHDDGEERQHLIRIQEGLKNAVFEAPQSIRSYCLQSHKEAAKIRGLWKREVSQSQLTHISQESIICPLCHQSNSPDVIYFEGMNTNSDTHGVNHICGCQVEKAPQQNPLAHILSILTSSIFQNVPLSILFDVSYQTMGTSIKVAHASLSIAVTSTETILHILANIIHQVLEGISHNLNPMSLLNNIMQLQRKAMGKTSESILTGIHSVATGVGSARTAAMHAFSKPDPLNHGLGGLGMNNPGSPRSGMVSVGTSLVGGFIRRGNTRETVMSDKMFQKLNKVGPASKVVKYIERDDEVLTKHAKKRIQRIMHYSVPLHPFVATVEIVPFTSVSSEVTSESERRDTSFEASEFCLDAALPFSRQSSELLFDDRLGRESSAESPFMSTPKSFPPTPSSRAHVLARGTRFAEDVVFLARDQLRVEKGMDSDNAQTRAMAKALSKGKRLAVFNASDVGAGIQLSCGQHCASKIGNDLYSTARSMIPVLRNSFVYFEMTVSTPPLLSMMLHHASLSVGLSTLEMPLNALVGAWKGSVGLCSTGQMLAGSQWCSPMNPKTYGSKSTVGCLIYLDDDSAFETWDGVMVTANVVFNVDGQVIIPANSVVSMPSDNDENTMNPSEEGQYSTVIPIFVPREEEIFPTLTLHSSQTEVLCRFCAEDILATSRSMIGSPRGVTVYAVDGSVLFDEDLPDDNDDVSFSDDEYTDLDHTFSSYDA